MDTTLHRRIPFLSIVSALAVGACAIGAGLDVGSPSPAHGQPAALRPNIVVIMTDDQTAAELDSMPNVKRLIARQGVRFRRAYVSYPVCCPSRATYMTGQYAHNHHVMGLYPPSGGYGRFDKRNTLPVWLQAAGYHTAHFGKFLNGYGDQEPADVPPGWSDWHASVDYSTYRMWGYTLNDNGRFHTYGSPLDEDPRLYQTDVLTTKALSVINRQAGRRPFYLSINFLAPHHEDRRVQRHTGQLVRPAPRHRNAYASAPLPRPRSFDERDMTDKPPFLRRRTRPLNRDDVARLARNARSRRASLMAVDDAVARIVSTLRSQGQLNNTYIIFTSDNGYMQGEHRVRSGKMLPYDPSTRVPLVVRGPGLPKGATSGELVANVDLAPTLLEIANTKAAKTLDGRSLLPFARQPELRTRRAILHETGGSRYANLRDQDESANPGRSLKRVLTYRAIRTSAWLYVRYRGGVRELYDLRSDPHQMHSLHDDPTYRDTRHVLSRELRRLAHCRGDDCSKPPRRIPRPR